jgi:hypothetical protein
MICYRACTYLQVSYGQPFYYTRENGSTPLLTLYFETSVALRKGHLEYDGTSLFAEIGGYTGLLLGVSLLDFAKMFRFVYDKIHTFYKGSNEFDLWEVVQK